MNMIQGCTGPIGEADLHGPGIVTVKELNSYVCKAEKIDI